MLSTKLNLTWDDITNRNIFWFKHKCGFVNHLIREENRRIQVAKMKGGKK